MTGATTAGAATLGRAAASWAVAVQRMGGMDMGVATALGFYEPHGTSVAGALTIAAGAYELTPLKREFLRALSRERALRMAARALLRRLEHAADARVARAGRHERGLDVRRRRRRPRPKLLPPRAWIDVPLGLAVVALGIVVAAAPLSVPG
jgi:hypothetical protein